MMSASGPASVIRRPGLSVAILAGGKSTRMQSDKAFLEYKGRPFVSLIAEEASRASADVVVVIGKKDRAEFGATLPETVRVANDVYDSSSPLAGMLTAFEMSSGSYMAVVPCDAPLIRAEVIGFMHDAALSHSAAVPKWNSGKVEPLCSVYNAEEAGVAAKIALGSSDKSCRSMISRLRDVNYVPVSRLRAFDPTLGSLFNFNTPDDLRALESAAEGPKVGLAGASWPMPLQSDEEA